MLFSVHITRMKMLFANVTWLTVSMLQHFGVLLLRVTLLRVFSKVSIWKRMQKACHSSPIGQQNWQRILRQLRVSAIAARINKPAIWMPSIHRPDLSGPLPTLSLGQRLTIDIRRMHSPAQLAWAIDSLPMLRFSPSSAEASRLAVWLLMPMPPVRRQTTRHWALAGFRSTPLMILNLWTAMNWVGSSVFWTAKVLPICHSSIMIFPTCRFHSFSAWHILYLMLTRRKTMEPNWRRPIASTMFFQCR